MSDDVKRFWGLARTLKDVEWVRVHRTRTGVWGATIFSTNYREFYEAGRTQLIAIRRALREYDRRAGSKSPRPKVTNYSRWTNNSGF